MEIVDISKLSYVELQALAAQAKKAMEGKRAEELKILADSFSKKLVAAGFEISEAIEELSNYLPRAGRKSNGTRAPLAVKYRGPSGETWTGQGRTPRWITESGKKKETFAV